MGAVFKDTVHSENAAIHGGTKKVTVNGGRKTEVQHSSSRPSRLRLRGAYCRYQVGNMGSRLGGSMP